MMASDGQRFCLKWNDFRNSVTAVFEDLRQDGELVDITLCCEGKRVKAHRMMLSACSPYFRELLKENPCQHPVFFLKDTTYVDLKAVIEFVYNGEVNVTQGQLSSFLKTAEMLQVRGLTGDDEKESPAPPPAPPPPAVRHSPAPPPMSHHLPPRHRPAAPLSARGLAPTPLKRPLPAPQPAPTPPKRPPPPPVDSSVYTEPVVVPDSPDPPPASPAPSRARHPSGSSGGPATPAGSEPSGDAAPSPADPAAHPPPPPPLQHGAEPPPPLSAAQDGRDSSVKVEKIDIADEDVGLEQALGQVVDYEGSYESEHSAMSGLLHQQDLGQGGVGAPLPGTSDPAAGGVGAGDGRFPGKRCDICFRFFKGYSTYRNHLAVHRGETTCPICHTVFSQKPALKKHMLTFHQSTRDGNHQFPLDQLNGADKRT